MSKRIKFEIGDRVLTIVDNEMCKGNIEHLHVELPRPVAIVGLEGGRKVKAYISDIIPEPKTEIKEEPEKVQEEPEKVQEEPKREPMLKVKESITITQEEFEKIGSKVCAEIMDKMNKPSLIVPFSILMIELHMALFFDAVEND